tara:strand:- start:5897 stop:6328 length:432 start_codon:yes stop_codon:yes gene_type:complete
MHSTLLREVDPNYHAEPGSNPIIGLNNHTHKHLLITALVVNPTNDPEVVKQWLDELVEIAGMNTLMPARAKYCDDIGNEGVTGDIVITTSHATIHLWEGLLQADLYSCREFDELDIVKHVCRNFDVLKIKTQVIDRSPERIEW